MMRTSITPIQRSDNWCSASARRVAGNMAFRPGVLSAPADGQTTTNFIDPAVADAFKQFHHPAAILRIVARERNLAIAVGQRSRRSNVR
jgi:hypothetical protein